jgi:hypothetical protein
MAELGEEQMREVEDEDAPNGKGEVNEAANERQRSES